MLDSFELSILTLVSAALTFVQSHRDARRQKLQHHLSFKFCNQFGWDLVHCWDLFSDEPHTHFDSSNHYSRERVLPIWFLSINKQTNLGLHLDIYRLIPFKLTVVIETTDIYNLIHGWSWPSFKVTIVWEIKHYYCMRNQTLLHLLSCKFVDQFWCNLPCCNKLLVLLEIMLNWSCMSSIWGRVDFIKCFSSGLHWDACKLICFKLGLMLDLTKLYTMIPVWRPRWPSGQGIHLESGRPRVQFPLALGFSGSSYQWLNNWHSSGCPARRLTL